MACNWQAFLNLVPPRLRGEVDKLGKEQLQELRLRLQGEPELVLSRQSKWLPGPVTMDDLSYCINAATKYSPWAAASAAKGYVTAPGGHRLGLCGQTAVVDGQVRSIQPVTSINLRVCREISGIANAMASLRGSVLIIGSPGTGKTTLLRDYIRVLSDVCQERVAVVDERQEIFPQQGLSWGFHPGNRTDILSGCPKVAGIEAVLRNMNPDIIAVDEIGTVEDIHAVEYAMRCGCKILATIHAETLEELRRKPLLNELIMQDGFQRYILLGNRKRTGQIEGIYDNRGTLLYRDDL